MRLLFEILSFRTAKTRQFLKRSARGRRPQKLFQPCDDDKDRISGRGLCFSFFLVNGYCITASELDTNMSPSENISENKLILNFVAKVQSTPFCINYGTFCSLLFPLLDFSQITKTAPAIDRKYLYTSRLPPVECALYSSVTKFHLKTPLFFLIHHSLRSVKELLYILNSNAANDIASTAKLVARKQNPPYPNITQELCPRRPHTRLLYNITLPAAQK